jgi:TorA maturation chaperone TorD
MPDFDDVEAARAQEYALLSVLLADAPDTDLLTRLAALRADASPLGLAHGALAQAAAGTKAALVEREFHNLFVGIGRGELLPYGSYYLTGFLHDRPLAQLRTDLARLGIERVKRHAEPEDHAAVLCDIMAGLIDGRFASPPGADRDMFEKHLAPWIGPFFADLEQAHAAEFYRRVGAVGQQFMTIESEAFTLAA